MSTIHEATIQAAEHRTAARVPLDDATRGALVAVKRHSPALGPRVDEVLRADEANTARKARRGEVHDDADRQARAERRREARRAFIDDGSVL